MKENESLENILTTSNEVLEAAQKYAGSIPGAWINPKHFLQLKAAYVAGMKAGIDLADKIADKALKSK